MESYFEAQTYSLIPGRGLSFFGSAPFDFDKADPLSTQPFFSRPWRILCVGVETVHDVRAVDTGLLRFVKAGEPIRLLVNDFTGAAD